MKTIKKYTVILVILLVVALLVYKLFSNKKQLDSELKSMSEYSSVIPVEVITPKSRKSSQTIGENGVIRSGAEIEVMSETSGKIIYVSGDVGERVSVGQILVRVEKEVIESQFKLAKLSLESAEKDLKRYKNLAGGDAITEQQLEASKLAYQTALTNFTSLKKQLGNTAITSPVNGVIAKRFVEAGDNLIPSMQVFSILQGQKVFVVKLADNDLQNIKTGQDTEIEIDNIPEKNFTGTVKSIGVVPDMAGRYEVEINISEHDSRLKEGFNGYAKFNINISGRGVIIPRKCIEGSINDAMVYLLQGDSVITRKIKAISLNETDVTVTDGLKTNDKVVLSGQINLEQGTRVKVINL